MILGHTNYRVFLKSVLAEKKRANPSYSMRAFAQQIGLGQSAVSQVLAGKKNLSLEMGNKIAGKLGLNDSESEYFRTLIQIETTKDQDLKRSLLARAQALNPQREVRELSVDFFTAIADWYHLAIKNMTLLKNFAFTPESIAKRLGISKLEAETAIERLLRLEQIEADPEKAGRYRKVANYTVTRSAVPNEALRRFHRQTLTKAIDSLETQTPKEKFIGSETFAVDKEQLPKAFEYAEEFLQKMASLAEEARAPTDVYHAGVQFFNLTEGKK